MHLTQCVVASLAIVGATNGLPTGAIPPTDLVTPKQAGLLEVTFPPTTDCPKPTVVTDIEGKEHLLCPRLGNAWEEEIVKQILCPRDEQEPRHPNCPHPMVREFTHTDANIGTTDPYSFTDGAEPDAAQLDGNAWIKSLLADNLAMADPYHEADGSESHDEAQFDGAFDVYDERNRDLDRRDGGSSRVQVLKTDGTPMNETEIQQWMTANHIASNPDMERQAQEELKHQLEVAKAINAQTTATNKSREASKGKAWLKKYSKYLSNFGADQDKITAEPEQSMGASTRQLAPVSGPATTRVTTQPEVADTEDLEGERSTSLERRSTTLIEESIKSLDTKFAEEYYRGNRLQQPEDHIGRIGRIKGLREGRLRGFGGRKPHAGQDTKHDDESVDIAPKQDESVQQPANLFKRPLPVGPAVPSVGSSARALPQDQQTEIKEAMAEAGFGALSTPGPVLPSADLDVVAPVGEKQWEIEAEREVQVVRPPIGRLPEGLGPVVPAGDLPAVRAHDFVA